MNILNLIETGGWPLKLERLKDMQDAYMTLNAFGFIAGNLTIMVGCNVVGQTIKPGYVFINGELMEFRESYLTENPKVIIQTVETMREFENGDVKSVLTERYATIGDASTSWPWENFKRPIQTRDIPLNLVERLERVEKAVAPLLTGFAPIFWCRPANEIPEGYEEDINWRGRMPIGFDADQLEFNVLGKIGGSKSKSLTVAELPNHRIPIPGAGGYDGGFGGFTSGTPNGTNGHTAYIGEGKSFSLLGPHRIVMFIKMKTL